MSLVTAGVVGAVSSAVETAIKRIFPDVEQRKREEVAQELAIVMAQIKVNEEAAKHPSLFVAGARPLYLWIAGAIIVFHYLGIASAIEWYFGVPVTLIDTNAIWPVVGGLLGVGGMRSFEKNQRRSPRKLALAVREAANNVGDAPSMTPVPTDKPKPARSRGRAQGLVGRDIACAAAGFRGLFLRPRVSVR